MRQLYISLKRHAIPAVMAFFITLSPLSPLDAQKNDQNSNLQQLLETAESETNLDQLLELADHLKSRNISLNEADSEELRQLPWLTSRFAI